MSGKSALAISGDGLEDIIGGFGPAEGPRRLVMVIDEGEDSILQFLDAAMNPAPDLTLGEKGEPALDLVEPGGVGRGEVDVIARPLGEPGLDGRRFVGGVIVHHEVDIEIGGHGGVDRVQKAAKLGGAMPFMQRPRT